MQTKGIGAGLSSAEKVKIFAEALLEDTEKPTAETSVFSEPGYLKKGKIGELTQYAKKNQIKRSDIAQIKDLMERLKDEPARIEKEERLKKYVKKLETELAKGKADKAKPDLGKVSEKFGKITKETGSFKKTLIKVLQRLKSNPKFLAKAGIVGLLIYGAVKTLEHYSPETVENVRKLNPIADLISGGKDIKKEYDWDKNGLVEGDEQKAYKMRLEHDELVAQGKAKAKYTEYDVNKDGQVDDVEKEMRTKSYEMRLEQFNEDMKKLGIDPQGELNEKQKAVVKTAKEVYGIK